MTSEFEIPDGVDVRIDGKSITLTGPKGSLSAMISSRNVSVGREGDLLVLRTQFPSTRGVSAFGMHSAVVRNMIQGVTRGFQSRLKIVSSHFPVTIDVREGFVLINNFLGERHPRRADVHQGVEVSVEGEFVTVSGIDKDAVAQTAANVEQATVVRKRDRRIFQDGIYLIEKAAPVEG